jgi:tetratricopeptide (TPR) repeat protein
VAPKLRRAILALLLTSPAVAAAQQQQGAPRDSDHLSRARALVTKKSYNAALAVFDSLVRAAPGSRDAALGRAQILAWTGRLAEAVKAYERWLEAHPKDTEALELLAHALSWAGRLDEAERLYMLLAAVGLPEADRALARLAMWRGDLPESERRWRAIVARRPGDSQAWVGLAQVLRGKGRHREARAALARAVAADPRNREAVEQLRWVEAALPPHVDPTVGSTNDTDGNRVMTMGATLALATPWDGELSVRGQRRAAAIGATRASSLNAAVAATRNIGRYAFRGSLGATRLEDASAAPGAATRDVLTAGAGLSAQVGRRMHVAGGFGRSAFDETAPLMRRGIIWTSVGAGASADLGRRLALAGEIEHARLTGATPNSRTGGTASLSWRAPAVLSLATRVRAFGYAVDPGEGYFAPRQYLLAEMSAQLGIGRDLGWSAALDGGMGVQQIDGRTLGSATQPAARGGLSILYRPVPGLEWGLSGTIANAASPATSTLGSYRATGVSLKGRVSF